MKLAEKLDPARSAVNFISRHDDAPMDEVEAALVALKDYIDSEIAAAKERRIENAMNPKPKA